MLYVKSKKVVYNSIKHGAMHPWMNECMWKAESDKRCYKWCRSFGLLMVCLLFLPYFPFAGQGSDRDVFLLITYSLLFFSSIFHSLVWNAAKIHLHNIRPVHLNMRCIAQAAQHKRWFIISVFRSTHHVRLETRGHQIPSRNCLTYALRKFQHDYSNQCLDLMNLDLT